MTFTEPGPVDGVCYYHGPTDRELRPYGPGGSNVCHPCATATPERERAAQSAFGALLDANAQITGAVVLGSQEGPQPFYPDQIEEIAP